MRLTEPFRRLRVLVEASWLNWWLALYVWLMIVIAIVMVWNAAGD